MEKGDWRKKENKEKATLIKIKVVMKKKKEIMKKAALIKIKVVMK